MIDFHCHIGRMRSQELNRRHNIPKEASGVFLHSTVTQIEEVEKMFVTLYASPHVDYKDSLDWLLSEVAPYKELIPVPVIHPQLKATTHLLEKLDPTQVPGIKIHCGSAIFGYYSLGNHNLLAPLFSYAEKSGLIVFVHTDTNSCFASELTPLLEEFQGIAVLLHCCREEGVPLTRYPSIYLETSGCSPQDIQFVMAETPERAIFGSDFPFVDYKTSLNNVKEYIPQIEKNEKKVVKKLSLKFT